MLLDELLDRERLDWMVKERYVNVQTHPTIDGYRIWNYGQKTQFDRFWNDVTRACRGLITNGDDVVIARPFAKFFNLTELDSVPEGPFTVQEKMDGSLGIGYPLPDGGVAIATRGSFDSEQARWATSWLNGDTRSAEFVRSSIKNGHTPLFEIIYPSNRIVVDYGFRNDLTYLTSIDIATGSDVVANLEWCGPSAPFYDGLDLETVTSMNRGNAEGFVLRWDCGTRAKVKHEDYVRLHRLLTGVNARTIWELLSNHQSVEKLLDVVPDEFYRWVQRIVSELNNAFTEIEKVALAEFDYVPRDVSRKEQAEHIKGCTYPSILFSMLDGKNYAQAIWRMIRPEASLPFKVDEA
mgnify:CR=1 FL=1